jgi:RNA polymerase sigma-70 factor (ECF subfamily)
MCPARSPNRAPISIAWPKTCSEGRRRGREQAWVAAQAGATLEADDRPSPEQALIARERLALVSAALGTLPERTVQVFRRYRIEGVPQRTIAAELGISLSAVEKHLQKAYQIVVETQKRLDADMHCPQRPSQAEGI